MDTSRDKQKRKKVTTIHIYTCMDTNTLNKGYKDEIII